MVTGKTVFLLRLRIDTRNHENVKSLGKKKKKKRLLTRKASNISITTNMSGSKRSWKSYKCGKYSTQIFIEDIFHVGQTPYQKVKKKKTWTLISTGLSIRRRKGTSQGTIRGGVRNRFAKVQLKIEEIFTRQRLLPLVNQGRLSRNWHLMPDVPWRFWDFIPPELNFEF